MLPVRKLMRQTNPVPSPLPDDLSPRAQRELSDLVASRTLDAAPGRRRVFGFVVPAVAIALLAIVVVGVFAFKLFESPPPVADEMFFGDTASLQAEAGIIIRATIVSMREQDESGFPEIIATASIDEVAKGSVVKGDRIEFAYSKPGSGPETPSGLKSGGQFVLLLVGSDASPASLVNTTQGYYVVSGDKAVAGPDNPVDLGPDVKQLLRLR